MKKPSQNARSFLLGVVVTLLVVAMVFPAAAAETSKQITANLNYLINVTLDGEKVLLQDADGNSVIPISYNGTTYLPIRALANLLGLQVGWDQATQTVALGTAPDVVDLIRDFTPYYRDKGVDHTLDQADGAVSGIPCTHWIRFHTWDQGKIAFNVMGEYTTLTFKYYSDVDETLRILGDNDSLLAEYEMASAQAAKEVTVNLQGTSQIAFQVMRKDAYHRTDAYVFDAILE